MLRAALKRGIGWVEVMYVVHWGGAPCVTRGAWRHVCVVAPCDATQRDGARDPPPFANP